MTGILIVGAPGYAFFEMLLLVVLEKCRFISWNLMSFLLAGQPL